MPHARLSAPAPLALDPSILAIDSPEDAILAAVSVQQCLSVLDPLERELVELKLGLSCPPDWNDVDALNARGGVRLSLPGWPPSFASLGRYCGLKHLGRRLSEAATRARYDAAMASLRARLGPGR